jgi:hypothetical protein
MVTTHEALDVHTPGRAVRGSDESTNAMRGDHGGHRERSNGYEKA